MASFVCCIMCFFMHECFLGFISFICLCVMRKCCISLPRQDYGRGGCKHRCLIWFSEFSVREVGLNEWHVCV